MQGLVPQVALISESRATELRMPGISVILPVKGVRQHSTSNWIAQMDSRYKGDLEFIFVVESEQDLAVAALRPVMKKLSHISSRVEVAGPTTTCSQKIHNMIHGVSLVSPASKYVLFLDDDVALHEESIASMVGKIERDQNIFLVTGYPFDVPPKGSSLLTYAMMGFHMPLLIPFCIDRTCFVWGGCMLLRREHLLEGHPYGIYEAWKHGGYSDDMLMGSKCVEHGLTVVAAPAGIFPQRLETHYSWSQLWNYLRRQLFVLDTYATEKNRLINHTMLVVHFLASVCLVTALITGCMRMILWQMDLLFLFTRRVFSSEDASVEWLRLFDLSGCTSSTVTTLAWAMFLAVAHKSLVLAIGGLLEECNQLSPGVVDLKVDSMLFIRLWMGVFITNAFVPFCIVATFLSPYIVWSGIKYKRERGKVVGIEHAIR